MKDENIDKRKERIEAAVFRRLVAHLRKNHQVQNIDLMNLADFCRNCLAKWYCHAAEEEEGVRIDYEQARERIYGMPYGEWKDAYQTPLNPEAKIKTPPKP